MKKLISFLSIVLFACGAYAQTATTAAATAISTILGPRNVVKTNLAAYTPGLTTANIFYEYKTGQKTSVGTGFGYKIPQTLTITAIADIADETDKNSWTGDIEPEGFYVNPYFRFYPNGAITGFYLEAFMRYYSYEFKAEYDFDKDGNHIIEKANGEADGFGGGIMVGNQFGLGPTMVLDIYLGFGLASGSTHIQTPSDTQLDEEDFADIAAEIADHTDTGTTVDIPFLGTLVDAIEAGSDANSAWADIESTPYPILRFGVALGIGF